MRAKWLSGLVVLAVICVAVATPTLAAPSSPIEQDPQFGSPVDNAVHPLGAAQREASFQAFEAKITGKTSGSIHQVWPGRYIELDRLGEDTIWTIIGEFGDQIDARYGGTPGPLHNQIPQPDRSLDNSTIWEPDFSQAYFTDLLFSEAPGAISMRTYYIEQSSNRYAVNGEVTDWVKVPFNEARYGANYCGDIVCSTTWLFVRDSAAAWYNAQVAAGKSAAEIDAYLSQFDVWDRYDYDGDSDFNEPDGYIDHFQAVHAGEGEETGGGPQGTDAIWSHRWYAYFNNFGFTGPDNNLAGGVQIGGSSYWIGDYTVEPENGGVGVFTHEYGHDLGLPDLYDTSGNTGGAENSTGFWTLYSSGSYGNSGKPEDGIGTKPVHMSAYEKLFLGWSNPRTLDAGDQALVRLGPAEYNTVDPQSLIIRLPDKQITTEIGAPYAGSYFYYSGSGNDLDNSLTRQVILPAGSVQLSAKVRYEIELDWDYAYLTVNSVNVPTNLSTADDPNAQNFGEGITGSSGGNWVDLTADLSAWAGQTVTIGFRYWTDGFVAEAGFNVDEIALTGQSVDGAEDDPGWTYAGFTRSDGTITESFFNAYIAEYRQYTGYDKALKTGPYNYSFPDDRPDWVEHFPYQDGLLVWYYDTSFADNNVGDNCLSGRCGGLFLPVDAHPDLLIRPDNGKVWRPRIQSYDSTFGVEPTNRICLHASGQKQCYGGLKGNRLFDDTVSYWFPPNPAIGHYGWASVPLPGVGVTVRIISAVKSQNKWGGFIYVYVDQRRPR